MVAGAIKMGRTAAVSRRRNQLLTAQNLPHVPGEEWFYYEREEAIDAVSTAVFPPAEIVRGRSRAGNWYATRATRSGNRGENHQICSPSPATTMGSLKSNNDIM